MSEMLFLITGLFVAYVVYVIVNEKKGEKQKNNPAEAAKQPQAAAQAPVPAKAKPAASAPAAASAAPVKTVSSAKPAVSKAAAKPAAAKKTAAPKAAVPKAVAPAAAPEPAKSKGLKDPKSGEVVSSYSNYRFMKRWIKEALVAEGLIDKIYKNDELNSAVEANIKTAISKLEANKKYQP